MIIDRDWIQSIRAGLCTAPLRSLGCRCETAVSNPLLRCCRMLHPLRRKNFMSKAPWRASIAAMRAIATMSSLAAIGLCRRARVTHWRQHAGRAGKGTLEVWRERASASALHKLRGRATGLTACGTDAYLVTAKEVKEPCLGLHRSALWLCPRRGHSFVVGFRTR